MSGSMRSSVAGSHGPAESFAASSIEKARKPIKWRRMLDVLLVAGLFGTVKWALSGHLIVNVTPSIPPGIYWVSANGTPKRGDLVTFPIPEAARDLLRERGYVPESVKLLSKPVAAIGGDHVCVRDHHLFINEGAVSTVLQLDRLGRPMPESRFCGSLLASELFVATHHDNSFDSRNFGPVPLAAIRGRLTPLLTF